MHSPEPHQPSGQPLQIGRKRKDKPSVWDGIFSSFPQRQIQKLITEKRVFDPMDLKENMIKKAQNFLNFKYNSTN